MIWLYQKTGEFCSKLLFILLSLGDASMATLKINGGIAKASTVDSVSKGFTPVFYKKRT
ncbi:TRL domain-containing protein [Commensalibacter communis]|uniref:TRL domain-containing protein n=1 Tax=Commensalibacter communis TaxID=2972786 RepID=UPI0038D19188